MNKLTTTVASTLLAFAVQAPVLARDGTGDARRDRGDRIEQRLDRRGDVADRKLDRRGDRADRRSDRAGARIDRRSDRRRGE